MNIKKLGVVLLRTVGWSSFLFVGCTLIAGLSGLMPAIPPFSSEIQSFNSLSYVVMTVRMPAFTLMMMPVFGLLLATSMHEGPKADEEPKADQTSLAD